MEPSPYFPESSPSREPPPPPPVWHTPPATPPSARRPSGRAFILGFVGAAVLTLLLLGLLTCQSHPTGLVSVVTATPATGVVATDGVVPTVTAALPGGSGSGMGANATATATSSAGAPAGAATNTPVVTGGGNATTVPPTVTTAPNGGTVEVTISQLHVSVTCGTGSTTVTITNPSSTQTTSWRATPVLGQVSPTSGTLGPRASQPMTISGLSDLPGTLATVIITSAGVPQTITVTCGL